MSFDSFQEDETEGITGYAGEAYGEAYLHISLKKRYCLHTALVVLFKRVQGGRI